MSLDNAFFSIFAQHLSPNISHSVGTAVQHILIGPARGEVTILLSSGERREGTFSNLGATVDGWETTI